MNNKFKVKAVAKKKLKRFSSMWVQLIFILSLARLILQSRKTEESKWNEMKEKLILMSWLEIINFSFSSHLRRARWETQQQTCDIFDEKIYNKFNRAVLLRLSFAALSQCVVCTHLINCSQSNAREKSACKMQIWFLTIFSAQ